MKSNKEGVERVLKEDGQYAFMMESTVVDYVVERQVSIININHDNHESCLSAS